MDIDRDESDDIRENPFFTSDQERSNSIISSDHFIGFLTPFKDNQRNNEIKENEFLVEEYYDITKLVNSSSRNFLTSNRSAELLRKYPELKILSFGNNIVLKFCLKQLQEYPKLYSFDRESLFPPKHSMDWFYPDQPLFLRNMKQKFIEKEYYAEIGNFLTGEREINEFSAFNCERIFLNYDISLNLIKTYDFMKDLFA